MRLLPIAIVAGLLAIAGGIVAGASAGGPSSAEERTITIHHSSFQPGLVTVPVGVAVTFTLRNDDPIEHEWIVGTEEVHELHRHGTEAVHDQRPDEVTVPAFSTRVTTLRFDQPGDYAYICHLPGHEEYGMRGILRVTAQ